jgi:hypothetical protein
MPEQRGALRPHLGLAQIGDAVVRADAADQDHRQDGKRAGNGKAGIAIGVELAARIFGRRGEEGQQAERGKAIGAGIAEPPAQAEQLGALAIILGHLRRHRGGRDLERADRHAGERRGHEDPHAHLEGR